MDTNNKELMPSIIKVIGVGGGGSNAVNQMHRLGIKDVDFVICNTDVQALDDSSITNKIQLGLKLTEGRGAGNKPEKGKESALENFSEIEEMLANNTKMAFVTAGMGGGTGTGAAPVIAKVASEMGILTIGIVTIPFRFEGQKRLSQAIEGIKEMNEHVDSLLIISNEKLREIYGDLTISDAFSMADMVLTTAAKGIAEIITVHGYVNVDFADVQTVMKGSGVAIMGSAIAKGENRAIEAIKDALNSPLLNNNDINGAENILLNITSGNEEATMSEIAMINDFVQESAGSNANIIWGNGTDLSLEKNISVTVIATGFNTDIIPELYINNPKETTVFNLNKKGNQNTKGDTKKHVQNKIEFNTSENISLINQTTGERRQTVIEPEETYENETSQNSPESDKWQNEVLLDEMESVPAYKRKGVHIEKAKYTEGTNVSRYSLSDIEDGVTLRKNSYLHDKVD